MKIQASDFVNVLYFDILRFADPRLKNTARVNRVNLTKEVSEEFGVNYWKNSVKSRETWIQFELISGDFQLNVLYYTHQNSSV